MRSKFTSCSASAQKPQPARGCKTSRGGPGSTLMRPWLEGRTTARRLHHVVELAEVVMSRPPCCGVVSRLGGPPGSFFYVERIVFNKFYNVTLATAMCNQRRTRELATSTYTVACKRAGHATSTASCRRDQRRGRTYGGSNCGKSTGLWWIMICLLPRARTSW